MATGGAEDIEDHVAFEHLRPAPISATILVNENHCLALLLALAAFAQKRPITHEDVWLMKRTGEPVVSPDGRSIVVAVTEPDYDAARQSSDLWLVAADGREPPRRLTFSKAAETTPVWSPDGSRLAFVTRREADEAAQVYVLPMRGGEAERIAHIAGGAANPQWRPDGKAILFESAYDPIAPERKLHNDPGNGGGAYSYKTALSTTPSIDTVQDFKIETTNTKAEYEGSAAISIVSKSGTNQLRGSLFEFNRNRVVAAKNFFATSQPKPAFNRNEFGGTVGGPFMKNRTFFFGSYEGPRQRTASTPFLSYGTAAMRSGDFTGLPALRDPLTDDVFPNNRIPASRLDSRSQTLLGFVPPPHTAGTGPAGTGANYVTSVPNIIDVNRYSARVDHQLSPEDSLSAILNYSKGSPYFVYNGGPNQFGNFADGGYITKSATLGYTRSITAATINEFRYAYFSHASIRVGQNPTFNPASLFPQLYQPLPLGGLPTMSITGFSGISDSGGSARAPEITQQLTDNFTFIRGKHTFKTGVDIGFTRVATNPSAGSTQFGNFSFNGRYSNNAYADFLLGYPVTALRGTPGLVNLLYNSRYSAYFQDDWKISSRLTLNLGMRYLLQTAEQERDGSFANFDFSNGKYVIRSVNGQLPRLAIPRLLEAYPYVTSEKNGWGSDVLLSDHTNFAPRFGFAWRPFGGVTTVVRGGYGIYYNIIPIYIGIRQISLTNTPFQLSESFEAAAGNTPSLTLANPFPGQGALSPNPNITAVNRDSEIRMLNNGT